MPGDQTERISSQGDGEKLSRETLVQARQRDSEALSEFFDAYFDRVYSLAARLLGDRSAAEDVTQNVFLKIHKAIDTLDVERNPAPWVTAITYNACRDYWRSQKLGRSIETAARDEFRGEGVALGQAEPDPESTALARERERLVQDALMRLPEELRVVVVLRDYHGLRHQEIATIVQASDAAVRKRYSRALAMLAEELKDYWNA